MASMDGLCFALLREYGFNVISVMYMASTNELSFTREYDIILCRICDRSIIQSKTQSISWLMPITAAYSFIQTMKGIPGIKDPFQYKDQLFGYIDAFRKNIYLLDGIYIYIYMWLTFSLSSTISLSYSLSNHIYNVWFFLHCTHYYADLPEDIEYVK